MTEAYIFDALRTPLSAGNPTGALYEIRPIQLLLVILHHFERRHHLRTPEVDDLIVGCVSPIDDQGYNLARAAVLYAGWDSSVSGMQCNRFAASGLEAIQIAASRVIAGWSQLVVAGGVDSVSRVPVGTDRGALLYDPDVIHQINYIPRGVSADLLATRCGYSREDLDDWAKLSHRRTRKAISEGRFASAMVPIHDQNGLIIVDQDQPTSLEFDLDALAQLAPAYAEYGHLGFDEMARHQHPDCAIIEHLHTYGNTADHADGAALLLVGRKDLKQAGDLIPRARIRIMTNISVAPADMLTAGTVAAGEALKQSGMTPADIDLWECHEAFAAMVLHFRDHFNLQEEQLNSNGGAIGLGYSPGATGACLVAHLLDELVRQDKKTGMVSIGTAGGTGLALILERV